MEVIRAKITGSVVLAVSFTLVLALGGCSPQSSSGEQEGMSADAPVSAASFAMDADCGTCHATEQASTTDSTCLASTHAAAASCVVCHSDEAALTKEHEGATADGKMPKRLKRTDVTSDTCLSCHGDEAARIAATADTTVCTDSEGTTVNPHDLPAGEDHQNIACRDCHAEHTQDSALELAPEECKSCHHSDVYQCHTCHE